MLPGDNAGWFIKVVVDRCPLRAATYDGCCTNDQGQGAMMIKQKQELMAILNNLQFKADYGLPVKEDALIAINYLNNTFGEWGNELLWAKVTKLAYRLSRA